MTVITVSENSIEINGHAPNAIVCHGISAIGNMVANHVSDNKWGEVEEEDGYLKICNIQEEHLGDSLFIAMMVALKDMQREYPNNIEFKYE